MMYTKWNEKKSENLFLKIIGISDWICYSSGCWGPVIISPSVSMVNGSGFFGVASASSNTYDIRSSVVLGICKPDVIKRLQTTENMVWPLVRSIVRYLLRKMDLHARCQSKQFGKIELLWTLQTKRPLFLNI